jgi:sugar transferase EpsL
MNRPLPTSRMAGDFVKRSLDLLLVFMGLLLIWPVLLVIALLVRCCHGTPVIFRQVRPGLYSAPFTIYKFRTMTDRRDQDGALLPDGERLTAFGIWLRRYSLDELPELYNVLKGDMSLVGPRPLLAEYLPYYTPEENHRHDIRPGITGWAQIHGRNHLPWKERLAYDVWYVEHRSLGLDMRILWRTLQLVIRREGVAADPDTAETNLREERSRTIRQQVAAAATGPRSLE